MSFSFPKQSLSKDGNFKFSVNLGDTNQDLKKKKIKNDFFLTYQVKRSFLK